MTEKRKEHQKQIGRKSCNSTLNGKSAVDWNFVDGHYYPRNAKVPSAGAYPTAKEKVWNRKKNIAA